MPDAEQLQIRTNVSAEDMAEAIFGNGIELRSASYTGARAASGLYSGGDDTAAALTPSDSGVILSTGRARDITNTGGDRNAAENTTTQLGRAGDAELSEVAGAQTYDAAVLEAEFIPEGSTLTMQFVFSSEEYLEYVDEGFNDAIGVWVNGELVQLAVGEGDITIDNINDADNQNLYVDNPDAEDRYNTEMDGFTVTLRLMAQVNPDEVNTIRIAIADAGDARYDSNLLIAANSVQTELIAGDDTAELSEGKSKVIDLLANETHEPGAVLEITHINDMPIAVGETVTLATGEDITLNKNQTVTVKGLADVDADVSNLFTYKVADDLGNTDIGYVTLTTVPCFVAGTLIDTREGPQPVETLAPGTEVWTRDHGYQPLRWRGISQRRAIGADAPVRIDAGALGDHGTIELSPSHRVLLRSAMAEMLFGESEVLVPAHHLINDHSIRLRRDGAAVTYVHLLFDAHEVLRAEGLESESFHPGCESVNGFDAEARAEFLALMGEDWQSRAAMDRPTLKSHESRTLISAA